MSLVLAKVFQQAEITFSMRNKEAYKANFMLLKKLVDSLAFSDLGLNPILFSKAVIVKNKAPCTFINLYEKRNSSFSMSVFIISENGYTMPCHDHPRMSGMLKCLSGQLKIESYTRLQSDADDEIIVRAEEPKFVDELSECCVLFPEKSNFHELTAISAPAAFFDILSPPYSADFETSLEESRHCSFYKKMMVDNSGKSPIMRLVNIPVPDHYFCDTVAYRQPDFMR